MPYNKQEIFEVVKNNILNVLPDLDPAEVTLEKNLTDLGANSVDRVEVVLYSMEELGLKIPTSELHGVRNIQSLVDLLYHHATAG